ncbi:serine protease Do [Mucilaginibacter pineti]|uniref:Serine protease Do n=1 Tax=Mucilaginibacter pineti TaxID=1391627 RepID=A0A1G6UY73_9SPHI|nr:trypsin-like peptidase domain-containing protein [Mucilaginibacter pineti]SDD46320.1 serine protease Do [Mucilaginibacter pineti]
MKKLFLLFFFLQCLWYASVVKAQKANPIQLQEHVKTAIKKAYAASVLMWEYDTVQYSRMSAQFSGVVVSADGEILSAAHVVMPGKTYQVMFPDGKQCIARGLGRITIPPTFMLPDAAMLKIIGKGSWPFAQMGWSSSLKINQPCISIAYPESLEQRRPDVRFGHIAVLKNKYGFMESTCVMEPGDSGGPLFDLQGRLIGIHSGVEKLEDINYEVPVDTYRKYHTALIRAENYAAMPSDTNMVSTDPLANNTITAENPDGYLKKTANRFKATCVKISSIVDGRTQTISGAVFSLEGIRVKEAFKDISIVLSKNSMIGDDPSITLSNGKIVKATVARRNRVNDLAILLPVSNIGQGINLQLPVDTLKINDLGNFLISIRPDSVYRGSVLGSVGVTLPKITSYGYLGAVTRQKEGLLLFTFIQPKSAAETGGLLTGDQLLTVDEKTVNDELDVLKALQKFRTGDTTTMAIIRKGERMIKKIVLKYPPQKVTDHPADHFSGGKSIRKDGFENVFVHDARITPWECGGPIFDAAGNFMGINIARLSRTSTIAIPAPAVKLFIATVTEAFN